MSKLCAKKDFLKQKKNWYSPFFLFFDLSSFDSYLTKEPLKDGANSKVAFWESERFSERERLRGDYEWSPWIVVFRYIMLAGLNDMLLVADSFKQEGWESAAMVDWLGCQRRRSQRPASLYEILGLSDTKKYGKRVNTLHAGHYYFFSAHFLQKGSRSFLFNISSTKHLYANFLFFYFLLKQWLKKYNQKPYW